MANYLSLPGTAGHYASTPDHASFSAGDLDVRMKVAWDNWNPSDTFRYFGGQIGSGSDSWAVQLMGGSGNDGKFKLQWIAGGYKELLTATAPGYTNGDVKWLRFVVDTNNGAGGYTATIYDSDTYGDWNSLDTKTAAGTTALQDSTTTLEAGRSNASAATMAGKFYELVLLNAIGGSVVAHFNANDFSVGDSDTDTAVDVAGRTWTINGANSTIEADPAVASTLLLLGA